MSSVTRQLVQACADGDVDAAVRAIAAGADVNGTARASHWAWAVSPLVAAISNHHHAVVVALLSHGADANRDTVMHASVDFGAARTLQVLIDAGGSVNTPSRGSTPLYTVIASAPEADMPVMDDDAVGRLCVLLEQPRLELKVPFLQKTPEAYARDLGKIDMAHMIRAEVRLFFLWVVPVRVTRQLTHSATDEMLMRLIRLTAVAPLFLAQEDRRATLVRGGLLWLHRYVVSLLTRTSLSF